MQLIHIKHQILLNIEMNPIDSIQMKWIKVNVYLGVHLESISVHPTAASVQPLSAISRLFHQKIGKFKAISIASWLILDDCRSCRSLADPWPTHQSNNRYPIWPPSWAHRSPSISISRSDSQRFSAILSDSQRFLRILQLQQATNPINNWFKTNWRIDMNR